MKIVADENIPHLRDFFSEFGEVVALPGRNLQARDVADADALIVRSVTPVNAALLEGSRVKFVGTCTIGIDHLDTQYLQASGVSYASAPGCNAGGVVQYVLAAMAAVHGNWQSCRVGVIGCGNVGGRLCSALVALGVECLAYDPFLDRQVNPLLTDLDEVLDCDVVCLHTPYTRDGPFPSHHLINSDRLRQLRPGALLLNAGRGGAVDNKALLAHLNSGADLQVVLDVWENEPQVDTALAERVLIGTPHIAGYSFEGKINGATMVYEALLRHLGTDAASAAARAAELAAPLMGRKQTLHYQDLNQTVLSTYDIWGDHHRMQTALQTAEGEQVGLAFDRLRKTYPERREFSHFELADSEGARRLTKLGFHIGG